MPIMTEAVAMVTDSSGYFGGTEDELKAKARDLGFTLKACPSCREQASSNCVNCQGSGRLWNYGDQTLSDHGLRRFIKSRDSHEAF